MSVALLVGALNTETKAQKRLKFKFDELLFLFSLGLSWSCCGSVCAGILVVCVLCTPLCSCKLSRVSTVLRAVLGAHCSSQH